METKQTDEKYQKHLAKNRNRQTNDQSKFGG
jgi:hypothetical protein